MSLPLQQAIDQLAHALQDTENTDFKTRSNLAVDACEIIEEQNGLEFAENTLSEQLAAVKASRAFIGFLNIFGLALYRRIRYDLAITVFNYRIARNPKDKIAFNNIGLTYNRLGRSREAAAAYQSAINADPDYKQAGSNLLYLQHYIWGADPEEISHAHHAYARRHYQTTKNSLSQIPINLDPDRRLSIGFLSGDFRFHAVSRFIEGIFKHLDRSQFELYVYHTYNGPEDSITEVLKSYDIHWKRVHKLNLAELTNSIQSDRIDILFDLAVYTQGGNPDLIAQQVAPIQINYMGYPDTSGIPALNYRITDEVSDPVGVDSLYSEKLLRLPVPLWTYAPWPNLPAISDPPYLKNGHITFGSMNNHAKLQTEWLQVWAKVLKAIPNSVLLIKSRAINSARTGPEVYRRFAEWGISRERIIAKGFNNIPNEHFLTFHDIDIALDTAPYCGTTTTFDSLWMGVPVATMTGSLHVTRTSASILTGLEMADWVAESPEEFVEICKEKANDTDSLGALRHSMRQRMQGTSLGDAKLFCGHLSTLLRNTWKQYCEDQPAQNQQSISTKTEQSLPSVEPPKRIVVTTPFSDRPDSGESNGETPQSSLFELNPVISIIVCGSNEAALTLYKDHIENTIGLPFEFIGVNNAHNHYSLTEAYNIGGKMATTNLLVFAHDDVFYTNQNWGKTLIEKFANNPKLGLVGLAGTAYLQSRFPYWVAAKAPFIHGRVIHHNNTMKVSHYSKEHSDQRVVAIDGLFMASSRSAFDQHGFDEDIFDGFHFYDLDYSVRVSQTHDVTVTHDILVKHLSGGNFDEDWKHYRDRFRQKYPGKAWQCVEGQPDKDAHKQRLSCHVPAESVFSPSEFKEAESLGIEHPKHPDHDSATKKS